MLSDRIQRQIDRFLDEAEAAVETADWAVVLDRAQKVLRFDPQNADALAYLTAAERPNPPAPFPSPTSPEPNPREGGGDPPSPPGRGGQGERSAADLRPEANEHLDFAIAEFRAMKMQPALERALGHKGFLKA